MIIVSDLRFETIITAVREILADNLLQNSFQKKGDVESVYDAAKGEVEMIDI